MAAILNPLTINCRKSFATFVVFSALLQPSSAFAQGEAHFLELSATGFLASPATEKVGEPHIGAGVSLSLLPLDWIKGGLFGSFAAPTISYDRIGGRSSVTASASTIGIGAQIRAVELGPLSLWGTGSAGLTILRIHEQSVSLGALGFLTVPRREDRFGTITLGGSASLHLGRTVGIFLSPRLHFVSPYQLSATGYVVEGGLTFGIF
jgi:hypothetical protein